MRNKFSELINQGVAAFKYTPIAPEIPEQDMICRMYNNIWSIPSDTHMHLDRETGIRYITGHMVGQVKNWSRFVCACSWGAVDFRTSGSWSLCNFLDKNGLCGNISILNGDVVYAVTPKVVEAGDCPECPGCYTTSESNIPGRVNDIVVNGDVMKLKECYNGKTNLYDVASALNENLYIKGNEWTVVNNSIMCPIGNKVVIL